MKALDLEPCEAPLWAHGGHAQTILGSLWPSPAFTEGSQPVRVPLPDGDELRGRLVDSGTSEIVILLFHGLGGHSDADYMARTARVARSQGHSVYLMNHRGCGIGEGFARRPYHSGRGEDLAEAVREARTRFPGRRVIAIGFSLSGSALLNLVTGRRGDCLPDAAIAVNAPIDLQTAAERLKRGFNRLYDVRFVNRLRRSLESMHRQGLLKDPVKVGRWMTLHDFDNLYTAPASGFRDREDYYGTCSVRPHLASIRIPTLLLTSSDDPIVPIETYQGLHLSPTTLLHVEPIGGHMGYLTRTKTPLGTHRWLDYALDVGLKRLVSGA